MGAAERPGALESATRELATPLRRATALRTLAWASLALAPLIALLGREPAPRDAAVLALAVLGPTLFVFSRLEPVRASSALGTALLVVAALAVAPLGWLFGPNAGVAAAIALLALLTGLVSARGATAWRSVLVLVVIVGGQALITLLVLAHLLPDLSLSPVIIAGFPEWQHGAAHVAVQAVIVGAFFAGRSLADRYAEVHARMEASNRTTAFRTALLAEARADYRRAVRTARVPRDGVPRPAPSTEAPVIDAPRGDGESDTRALDAPAPSPVRTASEPPTASTTLWMDAHQRRMRIQHAAILGLTASGIVILAVLGRSPIPTTLGLASMALIALLSIVLRASARRRGDESSYAAYYAAIGALSVGPAFAFGLHSAFACVIAALLFYGGAFRAQAGSERLGRRLPVYLSVALTHGAAFGLVWSGLVPDAGNQPILVTGHAPLEPLVLHLLLQATYAAAFVGGWSLDVRFQAALREAAHAEASARATSEVLARTGADLEAVLDEPGRGLFSGQRVARYRVERLLASGGLGDVYEARRDGDDARIALKLVRWDRAAEPIALELLAKEASALARISSPSVAKILEAGVAEDLPFVAMELIEGESLADVLRAEGKLSAGALAGLVRDLCRGVRDVHDAGVVHRDLKPHNVMRTHDAEGASRWKIVDFGLAMHGLPSGQATLGGTAAYVAPEQALGERVDPRADLYSLCLVLYRALTGRPAYVGDDATEIALRARRSGPPDPSSLVPIGRELALVLRIGLAADPKDRFATARELGNALSAALEDRITDAHRARAESLLARAPWS